MGSTLHHTGVGSIFFETQVWPFPAAFFSRALDDGFFVGRQAGAFEKEGADLALELTDGPVVLEAFVLVEGALPRVVETDEFLELAPGIDDR